MGLEWNICFTIGVCGALKLGGKELLDHLVKSCGIVNLDYRFHELRHFMATSMAASGVGIRTIAGRLGHADPSLTLRTYAHWLESADREAADVVEGVLGEAMKM